MSIFSKLIGNRKNSEKNDKDVSRNALNAQVKNIMEERKANAALKSEEELMKVYAEYFAPNKDFYSRPGSEVFQAYFGVINTAKNEMLNNPGLYQEATKRNQAELQEMLNKPKPIITNILICALIFTVGEYAVIKDDSYYVSFCDSVPNCVALYLLLTAQKQPKDKRRQSVSAGDGANTQLLQKAVKALTVCDRSWQCKIT